MAITHSKYCTQESRKGCTLYQTSKTLNPKSTWNFNYCAIRYCWFVFGCFLTFSFHFGFLPLLHLCCWCWCCCWSWWTCRASRGPTKTFRLVPEIGLSPPLPRLRPEDRIMGFTYFLVQFNLTLCGFNFNYFLFLFTDYVPYISIPPFFVSLSLFCIFLSSYLFLFISLSVSFCHSLFLPVSLFLSPCLSLSLSLSLSFSLPVPLSVSVCFSLPFSVSICQSLSLSKVIELILPELASVSGGFLPNV